jgi:exodeoxyribonuclease III
VLSVLTVNIGAASPGRARLLLDWLARRPEEVLVITETSAGPRYVLVARPVPPRGFRGHQDPRGRRRAG